MSKIKSVLFDLDGTLLDTADDLGAALNALLVTHHLPKVPIAAIRAEAGAGCRGLLKLGFNINETDSRYPDLCTDLLTLYQRHLLDHTLLFPGMQEVLDHLNAADLPWGIVTNKPERFTLQLVEKLGLAAKTNCIISGDSLTTRKPHPEPILHACRLLQADPLHCVMIGDSEVDIIAGKAAGTQTWAALYGYIPADQDPLLWQADRSIHHPLDIINHLTF